jgi:anti-anti-sigma factor
LTLIDHFRSTGTDRDRPIVTIPLAGEFDGTREAELLHILEVLDLPESCVVRLEMSRVTAVDLDGLCGMLAARAFLQGGGSDLQLLCPNSQVRHVLDAAGLGRVLRIADEHP